MYGIKVGRCFSHCMNLTMALAIDRLAIDVSADSFDAKTITIDH